MKLSLLKIFAILGLILPKIAYSNQPQSCELKIGWDKSIPQQWKNSEGKMVGTDAEFLNTAIENMGCKAKYIELPWSRTLNLVESGEIDIAIGAKVTEERKKFAHYSPSYKSIEHSLWVLKDSKISLKIKDFLDKGYSLGIMLGWGYPPKVADLINQDKYQKQIHRVSSTDQLIRILDTGRMKGIIFNPSSLDEGIKRLKITSKFSKIDTSHERLHFLFSKKSSNLNKLASFSSEIEKLNKSKLFEKLKAKYKQ
jgi:polar amino acid transport system substrate-binding protein